METEVHKPCTVTYYCKSLYKSLKITAISISLYFSMNYINDKKELITKINKKPPNNFCQS